MTMSATDARLTAIASVASPGEDSSDEMPRLLGTSEITAAMCQPSMLRSLIWRACRSPRRTTRRST